MKVTAVPASARTLRKEVQLEGAGIHSGQKVRLKVLPATNRQGITFRRTDIPGSAPLSLTDLYNDGPAFRTALKKDQAEVHTIEHILSAFAGLGVSDASVEVDGPEIPALDGSALPFVQALNDVGLSDMDASNAPVEPYVITAPVSASEGLAQITAVPYPQGLKITYTLDYPSEPLAQGTHSITLDEGDAARIYEQEIAPARTFCLRKEAEMLLAAGFGKGAGTHNTLVLDGGKAVEVRFRQLKALFFVASLEGNASRQDASGFIQGPAETQQGKKIAVRFRDGEFMCGYTLSWSPEREGFFLFPADPGANNQRVFVISAATLEIKAGPAADALAQRMLAQSPRRGGQRPAA